MCSGITVRYSVAVFEVFFNRTKVSLVGVGGHFRLGSVEHLWAATVSGSSSGTRLPDSRLVCYKNNTNGV